MRSPKPARIIRSFSFYFGWLRIGFILYETKARIRYLEPRGLIFFLFEELRAVWIRCQGSTAMREGCLHMNLWWVKVMFYFFLNNERSNSNNLTLTTVSEFVWNPTLYWVKILYYTVSEVSNWAYAQEHRLRSLGLLKGPKYPPLKASHEKVL